MDLPNGTIPASNSLYLIDRLPLRSIETYKDMLSLFTSHVKPGNVAVVLQRSRISQSLCLFHFIIFHRCCRPVKTPLMMLAKNPSLRSPSPPNSPQHVNIKRWCIRQSMLVTLLCCCSSFLPGPRCDLVGLLRLSTRHGAPLGEGEICVECVHLFYACVWMYVCFHTVCVCVCLFSIFGIQHGNYGKYAYLHECVHSALCTPSNPIQHPPLWDLGCTRWKCSAWQSVLFNRARHSPQHHFSVVAF